MCLAANPASAREAKRVVLAPISTLGSEATSKQTQQISKAVAAGIAAVPGHSATAGKDVRRAIRKAKRSELKVCDGDVECLSALGTLMNAPYVVYGELGGLGDAQVLTLKLVDVAARRETRSTTAQFSAAGDIDTEARAAAYRLLAPGLYVGQLALEIDIEGAIIFLDGEKVATSPTPPIKAEVGNHALRVTHPEYRDYVRFVDVRFDEAAKLEIGMRAFPIIEDEMRQQSKGAKGPIDTGSGKRKAAPWYHRWYTIAGAGAIVFVGSAVIVGLASDGIDSDREEVVGD
jgi:hypothetical protein